MWRIRRDHGAIWVQPVGELTVAASQEAFSYLERLLHDEPAMKVTLVIDLSQLDKYAAEVRSVWQEGLLEHQDRFARIYWVTASPLFRMVAAGVSLFTGISCEVVPEVDELVKKLSSRRCDS